MSEWERERNINSLTKHSQYQQQSSLCWIVLYFCSASCSLYSLVSGVKCARYFWMSGSKWKSLNYSKLSKREFVRALIAASSTSLSLSTLYHRHRRNRLGLCRRRSLLSFTRSRVVFERRLSLRVWKRAKACIQYHLIVRNNNKR